MGCTRSASQLQGVQRWFFAEGKGDHPLLRMVCTPEHLRKFVFRSHNLRHDRDIRLMMVNEYRFANKITTGRIPSDETHF